MSPALPRRLRHPAPGLIDTVIVLVLAGPVIGVALGPPGDRLATVVLSLAALLAIFARRRYPLAALAVASLAGAVNPDAAPGLVPALVILYTIASRRPWPTPAPLALAVVASSAVGELVSAHPEHVSNALGGAVECAAAVALGLYVGARRAYIDALRDRADRADRERSLLADRAVAQERVRIAQDLHDVVAHNVSLMVVAAQALGVTVDDDRVRTQTDAIADLGRQAMTEMHRTLRLLRADDASASASARAPLPTLGNLDRLIEQSRASGMEVSLTVEGEPRPLGETVELSAFRIVQEALTNVIKHAGRARTTVVVSFGVAGLELRITDSGAGALPAPLAAGRGGGRAGGVGESEREGEAGGHGVIGMRERAALFGGTLSASPRVDHGFEVHAVLPYVDAGGGRPG